MEKILVATNNLGKFKEIKEALKKLKLKILSLQDLDFKEEVEEKAVSFEENAIIKAKFYGLASGFLTLADDTGLEVDILKGKLGVKSRRYTKGSDEDRNQKLLNELKNIPWQKRGAQFLTVIAIFDPRTKKAWVFKGEHEGKITFRPKGDKGFGYAPIFWSLERKKTFGELEINEKNKIGHRGRALKKVIKFLKKYFSNDSRFKNKKTSQDSS